MQELKSEHRISNIMKALNMTGEDVRRVYYAFDKLIILKKHFPSSYIEKNRRTYSIDCATEQEYITRMQWINEFMRAKGFTGVIFRNVTDFDTCINDYDYYNEFKTPTQYRLDEEAYNNNLL